MTTEVLTGKPPGVEHNSWLINMKMKKSQQVYCIIDKSRVMHMPFNGLSLFDYAVNASLVISNIVLGKQDKAGLITFAENRNQY